MVSAGTNYSLQWLLESVGFKFRDKINENYRMKYLKTYLKHSLIYYFICINLTVSLSISAETLF